MSTECNRQGTNAHPDLPPCVRCKREDYKECETSLGYGIGIQYACEGCDLRVVYRYCGPPGVLVWALSADQAVWDALNAYHAAVQKYRKAAYSGEWDKDFKQHTWRCDPSIPFPVPPAGLPAHRLDGRQWVRLDKVP